MCGFHWFWRNSSLVSCVIIRRKTEVKDLFRKHLSMIWTFWKVSLKCICHCFRKVIPHNVKNYDAVIKFFFEVRGCKSLKSEMFYLDFLDEFQNSWATKMLKTDLTEFCRHRHEILTWHFKKIIKCQNRTDSFPILWRESAIWSHWKTFMEAEKFGNITSLVASSWYRWLFLECCWLNQIWSYIFYFSLF